MSIQALSCASCGAELSQNLRYTRMLVCQFCGQANYLNMGGGTEATGKRVLLTDYGSIFKIGVRFRLRAKTYSVAGRMRFAYGEGFWDEWLIAPPNQNKQSTKADISLRCINSTHN